MATDLERWVAAAHTETLESRGGRIASYIPELATADPDLFGLAACTVTGEIATVGDASHDLTLQSLSKPFVYGLALQQFGTERVDRLVGVEPTGDAFDSLIQLDGRHRPHNPMVNAGAIAVSGLLATSEDRGSRISTLLNTFGGFAGRSLKGVDGPVYLSERSAGSRNRAIAHLMRHLGMLPEAVETALDLYFQQCSVLVNCRDLAVMAATLAAGGVNPLTGEVVLAAPFVSRVLAVMCTCGFYDGSGRFVFEVGLPAKSGVSGGVIAVAPGRMGIAAFSPPLDRKGSSVRGQRAIGELSRRLDLHLFDSLTKPASQTRSNTDMQRVIESIAEDSSGEVGGRVASYLPVPEDSFAIAVCSVDGREIVLGDVDREFSIQSAANPFAYAMALDALGSTEVHRWVGCEPSDNPFDAIHFDPRTERPFNPLDNAGAISLCSRVPGITAAERLGHLLRGFAAFAGEDRLVVDTEVIAAEVSAGDLNRAIAALLENFDLVDDEAAALDLYFQQCAIRMSCRLLARMGATLANAGLQPLTGRRVVAPGAVRDVLSVMLTCGLHDESGQFAVDVGLPAKTGISGGIVAAVPGRMGIAIYSPRVNDHGSSVRGLSALAKMSQRLDLSVFSVGS